MPAPDKNILEFKNKHFQHPVPYCIYADFESLLEEMPTVQPSSNRSYIQKISHHLPCGYAYIIVDSKGKSVKPITVYRGPQAVEHFLENVIREKDELAEKLINITPIQMTPEDEEAFQQATHCGLCKKPLGRDRVRDHDHVTGQFRNILHSNCNLQYKQSKMIPVVFHNLKNYDGHHIMQALGKIQNHDFNVIATNMEKYISFSINSKHNEVRVSLRFIDSFQFLGTSLQKLVANLSKDKFTILKENMPNADIDLLLRKGVYPYEYMSSFAKFDETALPPKEAFYSTLTGEAVADEDYIHAQAVWKAFGIQNMGDYHDLYVKSDVLQLADVFQSFRGLCKQYYDLDCAHLFTAPGLAWQACLKMTRQPLELFTDLQMHLFIERGIRGGIAMISKRWACANNIYMQNYDEAKPNKYIMYLDANNLYGWAMSQPLPYKGFHFVAPEEITHDIIMNLPDDAPMGYILEVDLEYPWELHDNHNDYPLAAERVTIVREMLSPYTQELLRDAPFRKCEKLVPNLNARKNYVIHYRNLKLYLSLGMRLVKIHKVLKFQQRAWLKSYINFNTNKRKCAQSSFDKDFFKLLNNSVYGKTLEDIRRRVDIQLVNNQKKAEKLVSSPSFQSYKIFTEELTGVERILKSITLNRPIYVGFTVLELSKLLMYDFHYNYIKNRYGPKAQLLFTDTDSLCYEIETYDIYKDMAQDMHLFDTSDYPEKHPLHSTINKKVIGKFKDEMNAKIILEFVGLRAKMYSILSKDGEKKAAKGVSKNVMKYKIKHKDYRECLLNSNISREVQMRIQSEAHKIYTIEQNKVALSSLDDKRYILRDGINTLSYGHHSINNT